MEIYIPEYRVTEEMKKLRAWLDENNIKWEDDSSWLDFWVCRTHFWYDDYMWSVIHGYGTWGGFGLNGNDGELLEVMVTAVNGGNPVGWLTAKDVIGFIKNENGEREAYEEF